jgi:hypothetical protein
VSVRELNGTTDRLVTDVGAASGMTYGTVAAIVKFTDLSDFRAIAYLHDSGGAYKAAVGTTNFSTFSMNDGSTDSNAGTAITTGVWYLLVVRKAAGAAQTPRFSFYNFNTGAWTHAAGTAALNDWASPGSGGTIQLAYQGGAASIFAGRIAARALWSNSLPWAADASGDAEIVAARLEAAAWAWAAKNPSVFHLFNQASVSDPVLDLSTTGTADEVSIVGTSVVADDPAGFSYATTVPDPLASYNFAEASGNVLDRSGHSRDFALTGTSARTAAGGGYTYGGAQPNTKGLTQGTTENQNGPSITGLNTAHRTVMFWGKIGPSDPAWILEYHRTAEDTGSFGWLYLSGAWRGRAKNSSNTAFEVTGANDNPNYHHWCLTHDGNILRHYRDGVLLGSSSAMGAVWDADVFRIFSSPGPGVTISEVRIYDVALDITTINSLKDTPVTSAAGGAQTVSPTGIPTGEAFGSPTVTATPPVQTVTPVGIPSGEQFGSPAISTQVTVSPSGISSGEALGNPTISTDITVHPTGIPSGEAFGHPVITGGSAGTPIDIEVTIGPTRKRERATVGPTRQKWNVGGTRRGITVGETRKDR